MRPCTVESHDKNVARDEKRKARDEKRDENCPSFGNTFADARLFSKDQEIEKICLFDESVKDPKLFEKAIHFWRWDQAHGGAPDENEANVERCSAIYYFLRTYDRFLSL